MKEVLASQMLQFITTDVFTQTHSTLVVGLDRCARFAIDDRWQSFEFALSQADDWCFVRDGEIEEVLCRRTVTRVEAERSSRTYTKLYAECSRQREDVTAGRHPCIGNQIDRGRRRMVMIMSVIIGIGCSVRIDNATRIKTCV